MAGNYPDAPSNRMLLDRDGTQMYLIDLNNVVTQLSTTQVQEVNSEAHSTVYVAPARSSGSLVVFFPEKRDVAGYYLNVGSGSLYGPGTSVKVSTNTTNGIDGTWTSVSSAGYAEPLSPNFRSKIQSIASVGIRAMKFTVGTTDGNSLVINVHIYGNPSAGENPDRLAVWHPTSDAHISGAYYDWGDVPRSSSADRNCRIKNLSSTLTASSIQVSFDALTNTTPSVPGQFTISADNGTTFLATVNIGDLAPGGLSPVLIVRRNTPANAALSVWEPRIIAQATSWS